MKTAKRLIRNMGLLICALFISSALYAGAFSNSKVGTSGAQFLKIGCGARAIGMGEAYTAVADDVTSIYWNPAGLSNVKYLSVAAMHALWLEDIGYSFLGFAQPLGKGTLGLSLNYLSMSDMEQLDEVGNRQGTFKNYDAAANIAYSHPIGDILKAGITVKYIRQTLAEYSASGYAADLGIIAQLANNKLNLAFTAQNLGPQIKFIDQAYSLPLTLKAGVSYKPISNVILAFDAVAPIDNDPNFHAGLEYGLNTIDILPLKLRAGYKTTSINDIDALSGLSGGIGFSYELLSIDYAWVPYGDLGDTHRISLAMKFGGKEQKIASSNKPNFEITEAALQKKAQIEASSKGKKKVIFIQTNSNKAIIK